MKFISKDPPRRFHVGVKGDIEIRDCGDVHLEPEEMVTLRTDSKTEFDIVRKSFGYYATPSLNKRLPDHGLRPALTANEGGLYYILLVEPNLEEEYRAYLRDENMRHILWLDETEELGRLG